MVQILGIDRSSVEQVESRLRGIDRPSMADERLESEMRACFGLIGLPGEYLSGRSWSDLSESERQRLRSEVLVRRWLTIAVNDRPGSQFDELFRELVAGEDPLRSGVWLASVPFPRDVDQLKHLRIGAVEFGYALSSQVRQLRAMPEGLRRLGPRTYGRDRRLIAIIQVIRHNG
jgi:hypothetical protein